MNVAFYRVILIWFGSRPRINFDDFENNETVAVPHVAGNSAYCEHSMNIVPTVLIIAV